MKLYHGSNVEVKEPSLHYSAKNRDFGQGFYLTPDINQAKSWAIKKANSTQIGRPIVSIYEIDDSELNKLNMKKFEIADKTGRVVKGLGGYAATFLGGLISQQVIEQASSNKEETEDED